MFFSACKRAWVAAIAACKAIGLGGGAQAQSGGVCAPGSSCESTNGNFETGDFTGWTQFGNTSDTSVFTGTFATLAPHGGSHAAAFGPVGGAGGISQVIPCNAGDVVNISFWYAVDPGGTANNSFSAVFDGNTLVSFNNDTTNTGWTHFTFGVIASVANPTLVFTLFNAPEYDYLDDISACVTPACNGSCVSGSSCVGLNGGFETGSFAGWTQFGSATFTAVENSVAGAHGGADFGHFGPTAPGGISQVIDANPGDVVNISFWYEVELNGAANSSFTVTFDGQTLLFDQRRHQYELDAVQLLRPGRVDESHSPSRSSTRPPSSVLTT